MDTRPLRVDRTDAWMIHDCLQTHLAGSGGRHGNAEPWQAVAILTKLRPLLLEFERPVAPRALALDLIAGQLDCIDLHVPGTADQGATALLLRTFHALEGLSYHLPLLAEEPDHTVSNDRRAGRRAQDGSNPSIPV